MKVSILKVSQSGKRTHIRIIYFSVPVLNKVNLGRNKSNYVTKFLCSGSQISILEGKYIKGKYIRGKYIKGKYIKGKNIKGKNIKGKNIKDK